VDEMMRSVARVIVLRESFTLKAESRLRLILDGIPRLLNFFFFLTFLNEIVELLEIEKCVPVSLSILLLVDEIVSLNLPLLHLLLMVLTHELSESAIELTDIIGKQLSIAEDLKQQFLLIFLANKTTLDPHSLISYLLSTIVEYLLGPYSPELFFFEALDFHVSLIQVELSDLATVCIVIRSNSLEESLILRCEQSSSVLIYLAATILRARLPR
jgi:hypothetical protein